MSKTTKAILISVAVALTIIILSCGISSYFLLLHHYKGHEKVYIWDETQVFDISKIKSVEKQKDKDFVILNLADVQMADLEDFWNSEIMHNEITYLVEQTKPDLITLTGDQTWSNENLISLKRLIHWLDGYQIPWAPVFGNHDYGNTKDSAVLSQNKCCDLYERSKYCLFDRGPTNIGALGNYAVNIMEDGKLYKTLYMLDAGYNDIITIKQIEWMAWNAEGLKQANGGDYAASMVFMHKPIPEYRTAYLHYLYEYGDVEVVGETPEVHYSLFGTEQNGFFDVAKSIGVTDVICGHQHGNRFTLKYEDVRLTFALKTGELGGYYASENINLNGATTFTLSGVNTVNISCTYVGLDQFHFPDSENVYKQ